MNLYATERISPRKAYTPEGFLICFDVPIARTGIQKYLPEELRSQGVPAHACRPGEDGMVDVNRPAAEVFRDATLASALGKPIVIHHPGEDVTPGNWSALTVGSLLNVRQGAGADADLTLADFLVTHPDGIAILDGPEKNVEVSCGYACKFVLGSGGLEQSNIIINHLALLPDEQGRCGPLCATRDAATNRGKLDMATKKPGLAGAFARLWKAVATDDMKQVRDAAAELETSVGESGGAGDPSGAQAGPTINIHNAPHKPEADDEDPNSGGAAELTQMKADIAEIKAALAKLAGGGNNEDPATAAARKAEEDRARDEEARRQAAEEPSADEAAAIEKEAPEGKAQDAKKARDSALLADAWQDVLSKAEILAPGIKVPTFDRAARPARTVDAMCRLRQEALEKGLGDTATAEIVAQANGGRRPVLSTMTCDAKRALFHAAAALKASANNGSVGAIGRYRAADNEGDRFDFNHAMDLRYGRVKA
jgi:uncharacterized protein